MLLIGLNRYLKEFKTNKEKENFILKNKHKYSFQEIFINNGICLELKLLKVI
jgi:hypothetical protein|tara:strand:+ start:6090 stop:6245 length:156 start_codon:yes stop_codon:yes gene_type:complete